MMNMLMCIYPIDLLYKAECLRSYVSVIEVPKRHACVPRQLHEISQAQRSLMRELVKMREHPR